MCIMSCARCKTEVSRKKDEVTGRKWEEEVKKEIGARHVISLAMFRDFNECVTVVANEKRRMTKLKSFLSV